MCFLVGIMLYIYTIWTRSTTKATITDSANDTTYCRRTDSSAGTVTITANFTYVAPPCDSNLSAPVAVDTFCDAIIAEDTLLCDTGMIIFRYDTLADFSTAHYDTAIHKVSIFAFKCTTTVQKPSDSIWYDYRFVADTGSGRDTTATKVVMTKDSLDTSAYWFYGGTPISATGNMKTAPWTATGTGTVLVTATGNMMTAPWTTIGTGTVLIAAIGNTKTTPWTCAGTGSVIVSTAGNCKTAPWLLTGAVTVTSENIKTNIIKAYHKEPFLQIPYRKKTYRD